MRNLMVVAELLIPSVIIARNFFKRKKSSDKGKDESNDAENTVDINSAHEKAKRQVVNQYSYGGSRKYIHRDVFPVPAPMSEKLKNEKVDKDSDKVIDLIEDKHIYLDALKDSLNYLIITLFLGILAIATLIILKDVE